MKILCVADHIDPLVYSAAIKERFKDVSLVLSAGDLPMEYLGYISSTLNKPILFVFGNHNLKQLTLFNKRVSLYADINELDPLIQNHFGSTYISNKIVKMEKLLIGGLGGSLRYNKGENQFTQFQMFLQIAAMAPRLIWNRIVHGRCLDILLTHASPFGIHDQPDPCHTGFKAFRTFIRLFKPRYLVHGHIHLYDLNASRSTKVGKTTVVNAYDHVVLDLQDK